ncbi:glycosyltransferase family 9 protein [Salibacter sp.]|uniref:glycosyltransferase family 9 protein n=1 Tax=Salibacter sp. TaxID=2010995 RepID=UPI00286FEF14|nr:glycosyltransferase family 9 protein [Salibacter sp.]MDR9397907.1 glycosyltransferase family 9 protein [Salibacter sp.]MDR9486571.1 glycosyltransferase family 9 protein [Salibacter sp.]
MKTDSKILVIQTAFIGDAILASSILETIRKCLPKAQIHLLVRKGNHSLYSDHPFLAKLHVWDKENGKYKNLRRILSSVRAEKYDLVLNLQRFGATGLLTALSGAKEKIGFSKNPFSFFFTKKFDHQIGDGTHEIERNHQLVKSFTQVKPEKPKLYPSQNELKKVEQLQREKYITLSPTSVWFTKQWSENKWSSLIDAIPSSYKVYLLGSPADRKACEKIIENTLHRNVQVLAGKLSLLESAAIMAKAEMNYCNDSAPMHLASAMNAPTTAIFCSTVPAFGFGPLSDNSYVIETEEELTCRPCGLHGHKACPKGHFKCSMTISIRQALKPIEKG